MFGLFNKLFQSNHRRQQLSGLNQIIHHLSDIRELNVAITKNISKQPYAQKLTALNNELLDQLFAQCYDTEASAQSADNLAERLRSWTREQISWEDHLVILLGSRIQTTKKSFNRSLSTLDRLIDTISSTQATASKESLIFICLGLYNEMLEKQRRFVYMNSELGKIQIARAGQKNAAT